MYFLAFSLLQVQQNKAVQVLSEILMCFHIQSTSYHSVGRKELKSGGIPLYGYMNLQVHYV